MSKKNVILLTLFIIVSVIAIIVTIWSVEHLIKSEIANNNIIGDKAVEAFHSTINPNIDVNIQLSNVEKQIDKKQKLINDFATASVEYNFINSKEIVDKDLISKWLIFDEEKVVLDEEKVGEYVEGLAQKYDTVGKERTFVNSHGKSVTVAGGPYGWNIDCQKETKELIDIINQGISVTDREPEYKQKAKTRGINDIGNTYVEVNMSEQKMWFYKEGELIVSTDIVTGNTTRGNGTPTAVGYIYNKVRNINLVGTGYVAFVHYWMKVNGSIGIHDASWRKNFGGTIYTTNGSHGCINTPYDNVKTIYENIEVGTPVVIFYEDSK
ncbi:MAG: L,D-transpeptidase family protein [Lachnotalea sp.]